MCDLLDTDRLLDLKGLSEYSSLGIPTLRDYIRSNGLPCFKIKGKILIKLSEFDTCLKRYRVNRNQDLDSIVDEVMDSLKG
ncbi:MAG: helix-turn-helix domain-containing protein [Thermodesulfobacteriota bacterium]|nr:helix-turn-helix domain-containing protein [Thermodesulfobacteriota bacterium]